MHYTESLSVKAFLPLIVLCQCAGVSLSNPTTLASSPYGRACDPLVPNLSSACGKLSHSTKLHCHPQRRTCACIKPQSPLNATYTYEWDEESERCMLVSKCASVFVTNNGTHRQPSRQLLCKSDGVCWKTLGHLSKCNLETCRCECEQTRNFGGEVRPVSLGGDGKCVMVPRLGDDCGHKQACAHIDIGESTSAICNPRYDAARGTIYWTCSCDPTTHVQVGSKCVVLVFEVNSTSQPNQTQSFTYHTEVTDEPTTPTVEPTDIEDIRTRLNSGRAAIVVFAVVMAIILFSCWLLFAACSNWRRKRRAAQAAAKHHYLPPEIRQPLVNGLPTLLGRFEVPEEDIDIERTAVLGSGQNGIVYRGYLKPRAIHVAVKTNRDRFTSEVYLRAILGEAKVLLHLDGHPNVVQFYGVCQAKLNGGNVYLLCELCPLGSLEAFLRGKRAMFDFWPQNSVSDGGTPDKLSSTHVYVWAYQIASAMEFVSARKVIHSDLAARNVLLASIHCVKLTDFGLSRRLYDNYTYMKTTPEPLPWKWLDYDALRFGIFTTHTDVWSFGITLWEIWTLGDVPYLGILTPYCQDFMNQLLAGLHPPQPAHASAELFGVMVRCWNPNPRGRPNFGWLKEELGRQMKSRAHEDRVGRAEKEELDSFGYLNPLKQVPNNIALKPIASDHFGWSRVSTV